MLVDLLVLTQLLLGDHTLLALGQLRNALRFYEHSSLLLDLIKLRIVQVRLPIFELNKTIWYGVLSGCTLRSHSSQIFDVVWSDNLLALLFKLLLLDLLNNLDPFGKIWSGFLLQLPHIVKVTVPQFITE